MPPPNHSSVHNVLQEAEEVKYFELEIQEYNTAIEFMTRGRIFVLGTGAWPDILMELDIAPLFIGKHIPSVNTTICDQEELSQHFFLRDVKLIV